MRKISFSVKTPCTFCDSATALARSWPNGFSITTRALTFSVSRCALSVSMIGPYAEGGVAR